LHGEILKLKLALKIISVEIVAHFVVLLFLGRALVVAFVHSAFDSVEDLEVARGNLERRLQARHV